MINTVFNIRKTPVLTFQSAKSLVQFIELFVTASSVIIFSVGCISNNLKISFAGVSLLFLGNILYGCLKLRSRLLFLFLHGGIFLFLLTRPLIGSLDPERSWMLSSVKTTMFALGSLYVSMMCLLLGAVIFEGIIQFNQDRKKHKDLYKVKKPSQPFTRPVKTLFPLSTDASAGRQQKARLYIRWAALILFFICFIGSLIDGASILSQMQGRAYEEYYLTEFSQPWIIGVLKPMMPFMLCAYLATMPRRKPVTMCLILYVISTIPMLLIGSRADFVLAFLFAALYYIFRTLTDTKEQWITKRMVLVVMILIPLGIFAMGAINYIRAGSVVDMGFFALMSDALFKQGVSFTTLGHGFDVNPQIQDLGFKFFTMGSFISNITDGFIGQTFLGCPDLGNTNTIPLALYGHTYAATMSYFAHPNYLGGEGYGSSYILELFADFGWVGIAAGSFLLGAILCLLSRMIGKGWFAGTVALISATSVFHMPRGSAVEWISFIWTTRFLLAMALIMAGAALFSYVSYVGAKKGIALWSPETQRIPAVSPGRCPAKNNIDDSLDNQAVVGKSSFAPAPQTGLQAVSQKQGCRYNKYNVPVLS